MTGGEVFVPEDPGIRSTIDRAEDLLRRGNGPGAAETLARLTTGLVRIGLGNDPVPGEGGMEQDGSKLPESSSVISSGAGYSLAVLSAVRSILDRLSQEDERRWRNLVLPALEGLWARTAPPAPARSREILRSRIIRDFQDFPIFERAAAEEIDAAAERGDIGTAVDACRALASSKADRAMRLRAAATGAILSDLWGLDVDAARFRKSLEVLLESLEAGKLPQGLLERAREVLGSRPKAPRSHPAHGILDAGLSASPAPFSLGTVVWRSRLPGNEIRSWAAEVTDARWAGDETPLSRAVSLPFFPAAIDRTVFFQDDRRIIALRLPDLLDVWSRPFPPGPPGESANTLKVPALGTEALIVTHLDRVSALARANGLVRWERRIAYDRRRRTLLALSSPLDPVPSPLDPPEGTKSGAVPPGAEPVEDPESKGEGGPARLQGGPERQPPEEAKGEGEKDDGEEKEGGKGKGRGNDKQPELPPVIVLSAPVISGSGEILTALVRIQDEFQVFVVALDAGGGLGWATSVGSFRSADYLGQIAEALPPLPVGSRVLVPTNLGAVVALDRTDGSILWIREYPRLNPAARAESVRTRSRWDPNILLERDGRILAAPQDSNLLLALEPEGGTIAWSASRDSQAALIGADDRFCYLGGPTVSAVRLKGPRTGTVAWRWSPEGRSNSLGRAILAGERLLVSLEEGLIQIEASTGKAVSTTLWDYRGGGGNLLLLDGFLAVAGSGEFLIYDTRRTALARISGLPEEERLLEMAMLHLKGGERAEACAALDSWTALKPKDPPANSPLYRRRFELAEIAGHWIDRAVEGRISWVDLSELYRYRVVLEPLPERKMVAAIRAAIERRKAKDFQAAVGHLESALLLDIPASAYPLDDVLSIPAIDVIRDELAAIREAGPEGASAFQGYEGRAREILEDARRVGTQAAFRRVIDRCPLTDACRIAGLELADYLLNQQNPAEAVRCLQEVLSDASYHSRDGASPPQSGVLPPRSPRGDGSDVPRAEDVPAIRLQIADLLVETGRFADARAVLDGLRKEHGDAEVTLPAAEGIGVSPPQSPRPSRAPVLGTVPDGGRKAPRKARMRDLVDERLSNPRFEAQDGPSFHFPIRKRWRSKAELAVLTNRSFLHPLGDPPPHLAGTFITQSRDEIGCRRTEDGFPIWIVELSLIPGFSRASGSAAIFAPPRISARFQGASLLIQDQRNLLSIDTRTGQVEWHRPFDRPPEPAAGGRLRPAPDNPPEAPPREPGAAGNAALPRPGGRGRILQLPEMVRGFTSSGDGVFVTTNRRRLLALHLDGSPWWEHGFDADLALEVPPVLAGDNLMVFQEAPVVLHILDPRTGSPRAKVDVEMGADARLIQAPEIRPDGTVLLATPAALHFVDVEKGQLIGNFRPSGAIQRIWVFPRLTPEQVVVHVRTQGLPELIGVDVESFRILWKHDKLPVRRSEISVQADGHRLYVIHGENKWSLTALDLRPGAERGRLVPVPIWPVDISIGTFFNRESERQIFVTEDAILIPDPSSSSVMVYDKLRGTNRTFDLGRPIARFLRDKRMSRFSIDIVDGVLIVLADRGDCAFEPPPRPDDGSETAARTALIRKYLEKPDDWDNLARLALRLFRDGESGTAIAILDRALVSESLPSVESPGRHRLLGYLLDGIKEEAEAEKGADERLVIPCRRMRSPPSIDGELNDPWNRSCRVSMRTARNISAIPAPGQPEDTWVGEEDLSAVLYTGWDDEFLYFALDVEDNQLFPFDKDADYWRGDCLIIGIDPTADGGFIQRSDDQLMTLALTLPKRKPPGKEGQKDEDEEDEDEAKKPKGYFSVKRKDDNSGAVYEVALPWSSFENEDGMAESPAPGRRLGLSLLLTDDDTGQGATKTLSLTPCHLLPRDPKKIWQFLIPEYFPKVVLEE